MRFHLLNIEAGPIKIMGIKSNKRNVYALRSPMNDESLRRQIAELAADSKNVVITKNASERMVLRDVSYLQVI